MRLRLQIALCSSSNVNLQRRPLLILDLDETLIHGSDVRLHREADFRVGPYHVYVRPHLEEFLSIASELFELAIWSSATADYVGLIARKIGCMVPNWEFVWSRARCVQRMHPEFMEAYYIKDLEKVKRFGYPLERVLVVDDTPLKLCRNYGNATNESGDLGFFGFTIRFGFSR
ncbi:MAG: HAD family hydrolase [Planctomycetales bacterium]|nr:HAD family hydrolase [Planctomycetales bacterium]MCA9166555.1 HAD family hydrolase [Planctomycetales bacterium]